MPLLLLLLALLAAAPAGGQDRLLSPAAAAGADLRDALSAPEVAWVDDGTILLYDRRRPAAERTIERFDPATGARSPAVDRDRALASLAELRDGEEATPSLAWPEAIHPDGRTALYVVDGDLFLLSLRASTFRRLTRTAAAEECPTTAPDGRTVAFVRDHDLFLLDLADGRERRLTTSGTETLRNGTLSWVYWEELFGREDRAIWWSPDSTALVFLESDDARVDESVFPAIEPATPALVRQRYPKAGGVNPTVRVGVVELASGATTWVDLGQPSPEYVARVAWLPDSRRLAVQTLDRRQQRLELRLVDRATGSSRTLLTETTATWLAPCDDLRFLPDGGFLWSSEREGHGRLYRHRPDGALERPLSPATVSLRDSSLAEPGAVVAVDAARGWAYYTACEGAPAAPALFRCRLDGSANHRLSAERGSHRVAFDRTATSYLDRHASLAVPPSLSLRRADGALLATLAEPAREVVDRLRLQTPELTTYRADDGLVLPARVLRPRDFDPGRRYPVILHVYGGPAAPTVVDNWDRDILLANLLLENGFVCVGADPRSAVAVRRDLTDTSYRRLMAAHEVSDLLAFVGWLKAQPWVDPDRVGVWGWSGGGTFTLHLMTRSDAFRAGIAVAAVSDPRYYDTVWTEAILDLPDANPDGYRAAAPATRARDLRGRLLLVHGTADDNVHPQNAWRFARELVDAGVTFDMMVYPLEKHGLEGVRQHLYATMLEFWQRWLGPVGPPPPGGGQP